MLTITTWLWAQPGTRMRYTTQHVNGWAAAIRANTTLPVDIACVTDITDGLDPSIRVIKPPGYFETITSPTWPAERGWPQCYRRLAMFHPDAATIFGAEHLLNLDLDMLITGNLDSLLTRVLSLDFCALKGTNERKRPYNGGLIGLRCGARPQVFTDFTAEGAIDSGKRFVGSDQAWISHCLGWGEQVIGAADGAVHYNPGRWIKSGYPTGAAVLPDPMVMVFFPGDIKAFNGTPDIHGATRRNDIELVKRIQRMAGIKPEYKPLTIVPDTSRKVLYAYRDPKNWGLMFQKAATLKGHKCVLFDHAHQVPQGAKAFVRVDQQDTQREISKAMVAALADRQVRTIPTLQESQWYDDKGLQSTVLAEWMPITHYIKDKRSAIELAEHLHDAQTIPDETTGRVGGGLLRYPFYSKAIDGAGSKCVRVIRSLDEAKTEIEQAFSQNGIPSAYTRRQQGYVLWQELLPGNPCTLRITVIDGYIIGHERRHDEDGLPIPGDNEPMDFKQQYQQDVAALAMEISDRLKTSWMCYDFLRSESGEIFVIEMSSAWPTKPWFSSAPVYDRKFNRTKLKGVDMFNMAVDLMVKL
jgi:hypothetical protein